MKTAAALFFAAICSASTANAQQDTAHHRAVYQETNNKLAKYRKVTANHTDDPIIFALTGWMDGEQVIKIASRAGEDGEGFEEYYLEGGKPLFVYNTYQEAGSRKIENRLYFKDGKIFKWLGTGVTEKRSDQEIAEETERLISNCAAFVSALKKKAAQKSK